MQPIRINDRLSIAAQPEFADFSDLAARVTVMIKNQPNTEMGAPGATAEAATTREAGLGHGHIPTGGITEAWRGIGEA